MRVVFGAESRHRGHSVFGLWLWTRHAQGGYTGEKCPLLSRQPTMSDVTRILSAIEQGDPSAAEQLLPLVYDELRKLAAQKLAQEKPGQTLDATALVHEAYLRLVDVEQAQHFSGRGHFFAAAAEAMRRILVEQARRKKAAKAGGGWQRLELIDGELAVDSTGDDLFAVDEALTRLSVEHARAGQLVHLRFFLGQTLEEASASFTPPQAVWAALISGSCRARVVSLLPK